MASPPPSTRVTLGEGRTPLLASQRIAPNLYFKLESCNPTGSYKDRFIAAELTHLMSQGVKACVATSSGNTGSSLASYCARYNIPCVILVNSDAPAGKFLQMQAHGARLVRIPGFVTSPQISENVFEQIVAFQSSGKASLIVSAFRYCPIGMSGVESIAGEINRDLPTADHIFVPAGSGGLFAAISQAMANLAPETRVHLVQPAGCNTIVQAWQKGEKDITPVQSTTRISGLSVPFDIDGTLALRLLRKNDGHAFAVTDDEVYQAQRQMMHQEGIYAEPAGATALAGYHAAIRDRIVGVSERSVVIVSGHGFKDPASATTVAGVTPSIEVAPQDLRRILMDVL